MIRTGNPNIDRAFDEIRREQSSINFTSGTSALTKVALTAGETTKVAHKLGRKLKGYVVTACQASAACVLTDEHRGATDTDKYLTLTAVGADMVVDLLVF